MIDQADLDHCANAISHGSRSFHAASRLLPRRLRDPALALYAFCRLADDEVDQNAGKAPAVARLRERLELCYAGRPLNVPEDRAFAGILEAFQMPCVLPEALLEGLEWDADERRYATLSELRAYSARVASSVGAMMCVLMRVRDRHALARACDLGVAMQLTNIARDVGEDAREGRLYLPLSWMRDAGIDPDAFLSAPKYSPDLSTLVARLLREAEGLYVRSEAGIGALPLSCRPGIFAARYIYAGIGTRLKAEKCDAINRRARTSGRQKLGWLLWSGIRAGASSVVPSSAVIYARPLPETAYLVEAAAAREPLRREPVDVLFSTFAGLKARDMEQQAAIVGRSRGARLAT